MDIKKSFIWIAIATFIVGIVACGTTDNTSNKRGANIDHGTKSSSDATAGKTTINKIEEIVEVQVTAEKKEVSVDRDIDNAPGAIQAKTFAVLKNSINGCFSSDTFSVIGATMFVEAIDSGALTDGRVRFLLPQGDLTTGMDILEYEKKNLGGDESVVRTTTGSDTISATYLRSLATVANVISHNCELDDPYCACATEGDARIMLARCLPQVNPNLVEYEETVKAMAAECSSGAPGQRRAIAAMLSSYAFAQGR